MPDNESMTYVIAALAGAIAAACVAISCYQSDERLAHKMSANFQQLDTALAAIAGAIANLQNDVSLLVSDLQALQASSQPVTAQEVQDAQSILSDLTSLDSTVKSALPPAPAPTTPPAS